MAELVEVCAPTLSKHKPGLAIISLRFKTEWGTIFGIVSTYLGGLEIVKFALDKCIGEWFTIKVEHREYDNRRMASIRNMFP